jgi:hypothetical protein
MNSYLMKYKYINKFFKLFGGYDYDDCCCGGSCGCCGSSHSSYVANRPEKGIQLLGGYDYDDCCCGGFCCCCGGTHSSDSFNSTSYKAEKSIQLFGGYDYDDCCCGGSCGCCGGGHSSRNTSEKSTNSFAINTKRADVPLAWGLYFQDGASPSFEGIIDLHNRIMFYLVVILFGVTWVMVSIMWNFNNSRNKLVYRYLNHGTLIELIWTVGPALVLVAIAFPSFKLLYLMDIYFVLTWLFK